MRVEFRRDDALVHPCHYLMAMVGAAPVAYDNEYCSESPG
jgi:hypothetical protein